MELFSSIFNHFFGKKQIGILMVGVDSPGKTTILYKLKLGKIVNTIPTIGFNVETVEYKNISFTIWDTNSQDKIRPLWRHYYTKETKSIIFVIDSTNKDWISEARYELSNLFRADWCANAVFLIYANKQDLPDAMSAVEITEKLDLKSHTNRRWYVQATSAIEGVGLYEGLDWLVNELTKSS